MIATLTPERLEVVRQVRNLCTTMVDLPANSRPDQELQNGCEVLLEVPVVTLAEWVYPGDKLMENVRRVIQRVKNNLEAAEAYARATGSVACTYDGVTWTRP